MVHLNVKTIRAVAIFLVLLFAAEVAQGAIVMQTPGMPGDQAEHGERITSAVTRAQLAHFDDESTEPLLAALDDYERAGYTIDENMRSAIEMLRDPVKRQAIGNLLLLYDQDPTVRELVEVNRRVEQTLMRELQALEPGGIHQAPLMYLDRAMGRLNFTDPANLSAQWSEVPEIERTLAAKFMIEVGEQWSATSDHPMAQLFGDIAAEYRQYDLLDVADGNVEPTLVRERMAEAIAEFEKMALAGTDPAHLAITGETRTPDEETLQQLLVKHKDELLAFSRGEVELPPPCIDVTSGGGCAAPDVAAQRARLGLAPLDELGLPPLRVAEPAAEPAAPAARASAAAGAFADAALALEPIAALPEAAPPEPSVASAPPPRRMYDPGASWFGDAGSGFDSSKFGGLILLSPEIANGAGHTWTATMGERDIEDGFYVALPDTPGFWSFYISTPSNAPRVAMSVRYVDIDGNVLEKPAPWVTYGDVETTLAPAGQGGGSWTRVTLHVAEGEASRFARIETLLPFAWLGMPEVRYQLTVERQDHEKDGLDSRIDFDAPTDATTQDNPVLFTHGFASGAGMWRDAGDKGAWYDTWVRGPQLLLGLTIISVYVMWQFWLVVTDILRFLTFAPLFLGVIAFILLLVHTIDLVFVLTHWGTFFIGLARTHSTRENAGVAMFDKVKGEGYFTATWEYDQASIPVLAPPGTVLDAGRDMRQAVNAVQQAYWNHQRAQGTLAVSHPDEIKVDLVGHSMGGLVSRGYADNDEAIARGSLQMPVAEGDVDKIVQIASPNGGSTPAQWVLGWAADKTVDALKLFPGCTDEAIAKDILRAFFENMFISSITIMFRQILLISPTLLFYSFFINVTVTVSLHLKGFAKAVALKLVVCGIADLAVKQAWENMYSEGVSTIGGDLLPGSATVQWLESHHNPQTRKAIIYGVPWVTWFDEYKVLGMNPLGLLGDGDMKLFDFIVSEADALAGPIESVAASTYNYDLHTSMVSDKHVQTQTLAYLGAGPGEDLKGIRDQGKAWDSDPQRVSEWVLLYWNVAHQHVATIGGILINIAKLLGGGSASAVPLADDIDDTLRTGNAAQAQARLARTKGLSPGPFALIGPGLHAGSGYDLVNATVFDPDRDDALHKIGQSAPDVAVLDKGRVDVAEQWLELASEPKRRIATDALPDAIRRQKVLVVPPGGLDGLERDASFQRLMGGHLAAGGTLLALGQLASDDWAAIPGLEGYGTNEAAATKAGDVVLSTFGDALAGQRKATPNMTADGFFTKWPANATVLLRDNTTGAPVLLEYPWGGGWIVATSVSPLQEGATRPLSSDERYLLRDLVNARRAAAPDVSVLPGANVTLAVPLANPSGTDAASVTVSLLDPFLVTETRIDVGTGLAAGENGSVEVTFAAPRHRGIWTIDARLRDANGTAIGDDYDVTRFRVSTFAEGESGFAYAAAPFSLAFTAERDAVLRGEDARVTAHVSNRGELPADATLEWWLPEMHARTGDDRYGPTFSQSSSFALAPGESATHAILVEDLSTTDALTARLVVDGAVVAESRFPLRAYDPSVTLRVATGERVVGPDATLRVETRLLDTGADAASRDATLQLLLLNETAVPFLAHDVDTTVGSAETLAVAQLELPSLPPGDYVLRASALVDGLPRGRSSAAFSVSGRAVDVNVLLPPELEVGVETALSVSVAHAGTYPIDAGSVRLAHVAPDGSERWSATQPLALAPGAAATLAFPFTPSTDAAGTHRLVARVTTEDGDTVATELAQSALSLRLARHPGAFYAGTVVPVSVRAENRGAFVVEGQLAATSAPLGLDARRAERLSPGQVALLDASAVVPSGVAAGAHPMQLSLAQASASLSFHVPEPSALLEAPPTGTLEAGESMTLILSNGGGVPASASVLAQLADAHGRVVAESRVAEASVPPLGYTTLELTVPADAAGGTYRLTATVGPRELAGAGTLRRAYEVRGAAASLDIATAQPVVDVGGSASARATVGLSEGALGAASARVRIIDPVPLPALDELAAGTALTGVAAGDAVWVAIDGGRVARLDGATLTEVALPAPASRIDDLAARGASVAVIADGRVYRHDGTAFARVADEPPLARRIAIDEAGALWVGTSRGLWRHDGAWTKVESAGADAVTALAASQGEMWAGLGDLRPRLLPPLDLSTRESGAAAESAVVVDRLGRMHVFYGDGPTHQLRLQHVLVDARGRVVAGPDPVSDVATRTVAGVAATLLADGSLGVAWHDSRRGGLDVLYRHLDENGVPIEDEVEITTHDAIQRYPALVAAPGGGAHLFWGDARHPEPPNTNLYEDELYHVKLDASGRRAGAEHRLTDSKAFAWQPRAVVDADGNVHVVYTSVEIRFRCFLFFCFPRAVFEVWHQKLDAEGNVLRGAFEVSTDEQGFSWFPDVAIDPRDGALEIVYQDDRSGGTAIYHRRLDTATGAALTTEQPVQGATDGANRPRLAATQAQLHLVWARSGGVTVAPLGADGAGEALHANDTGAYLPRIVALSPETVGLVWERTTSTFQGLRFARSTAEPVGHGLAAIATSTLAAQRFAPGELITSIAPTPSGIVAGVADGPALAVDSASRATAALHGEAAFVAAADGVVAGVEASGRVNVFEDALPRPLALATGGPAGAALHDGLVHVATGGGLKRVRLDTTQVLAEQTVPVAVGDTDVAHDVPGLMGRQIVEATLLNAAGQTLDVARAQRHAVEGDVILALTPAVESARPGDPVPVSLTVTNRGPTPVRTLNVSLVADGRTILARTIDLLPGDAASFVAEATMAGAMPLSARARQALPNGVDVSVRDHVPLEGEVRGILIGPHAATDAPFDLALALRNDPDRARAVEVDFLGMRETIVLAPGASRILEAEGLTQTQDTTYVATFGGARLERLVRQSAPPTLRLASPDVLLPGANEMTLVVENPGLLPVRGEMRVERAGETLATVTLDLAPGANATERVGLDVLLGENALQVVLPGATHALALVGSIEPVVELSLREPGVLQHGARIGAELRLRGPEPIAGTVAWDLGFASMESSVTLAPGQTLLVEVAPTLHGIDAGSYPASVALLRGGAALAQQTFDAVVRAPPIRLTTAATNLSAPAGVPLALDVRVENLGFTPTTVHVRAELSGLGEQRAAVRLDVGENRSVALALPIPDDAADAQASLVVTAGDERLTIPATIAGHRASLSATAAPMSVREGGSTNVTAIITQEGTPRPLLLLLEHGFYDTRLDVPAQEVSTITFEMPIAGDFGVGATLAHPSGRVIERETLAVSVDRTSVVGITAAFDRTEVAAGESFHVTVTTAFEGVVNVSMGSFFQQSFALNGTRRVAVPVPADLPSGPYSVRYALDEGGGTRVVRVSGVEASAPAPAIEIPAHGEPLRGALQLATPTGIVGVLHTSLVDRDGIVLANSRAPLALPAGGGEVPFTLDVPDSAAGPARVRYSVHVDTASMGDVQLLDGDTRIVLPGTWIESDTPFAEDGAVGLRARLVTTTASARISVDSVAGGAEASVEGPGSFDVELRIPVPENGVYPLLVNVTDADGRKLQLKRAAFHLDRGTPPEIALDVQGPQATLEGVLVVGRTTTFRLDAHDAGIGLGTVLFAVGAQERPLGVPVTLPPGRHTIRYSASDLAHNPTPTHVLEVFVDAVAPTLAVEAPNEGSLVLAGVEMLPILAVDPETGAFVVGVAIDGERHAISGAAPDADGDDVPDLVELLLGSDPTDATQVPSLPATELPPEIAALLADEDADGAVASAETAWGTSDREAHARPWQPTPGASPTAPRAILVAGHEMRIAYHATDDHFPATTLSVRLDGEERHFAANAIDTKLSLVGVAAGEHLLTLAASDGVGNERRAHYVLYVLPAHPDGLGASLAQEPRAPRWPAEFAHFLEEDGARLLREAQLALEWQALRGAGLVTLTVDRTLADSPPAVTGAPAELQDQGEDLLLAMEECPCLRPPGTEGPPEEPPEL